ncbi:MAG: UvrD-helicase domain-containing protein [Lachnospiraceae bacterium]|nr:UvrD-helicase domain-containing protein [Lachnospiraceae bacterium]
MDLLDSLNEKQREAVEQIEGPVLILAGAGSGKTKALTTRIAYMIDSCGINPWNIMALTFTNKAAGEMRDRVDSLVGFGSESIWVATFHSSCVRMLRRYIDRLGFDTNFTIYDTDDQKTVVKEICKRFDIDTKMIKERSIMSAISSAKDELISPLEFEMNTMGDFKQQKIARVYKEYQAVLKKSNALDFDDIIVRTVELFKSCPDVLEYYQQRFQYIMVDEYQDTNTAQFEFIRLLAAKNRNLCVVGDDDQSIYKFRGANIRNILDFEKVYAEATVIKLEQNYRSTQTVLDAANAVIKHNIGRKDKALWTDKGGGSRIHFKQFDSAYDEAAFVAEDISQKADSGVVNYGDCAILFRTNAQARLMEERFVVKGIPYDVVGGVNFYSRKEIKDLLAFLKTIDNGKDDVAVRRIINVPKRGIGATTIGRVQEYAIGRQISFYDALREADHIMTIGKSAVKLQPFVTMIQVFRTKLEFYTLTDLINDVIETTGYVKNLEADSDDEAKDRLENIDEFINKIISYEETHDQPTLGEFLEDVALVADIDGVEEDDNKVLLMTLHSAKGLEFPHVYMTGMEDGVFPSYMTITSDDIMEIEEERRLAYVGITRAKEDLTITCARQRMIHGETQYNPVSRFVKEIPSQLLDQKLPAKKQTDFDDYDDDSYERSTFKAAPFGMRGNSYYGSESADRKTRDNASPFVSFHRDELIDSSIFDKEPGKKGSYDPDERKRNVIGGGTWGENAADGNSIGGNSASGQSGLDFRPKAFVRKKVTAEENKPYIAKGLSSLPGVSKGGAVTSGSLEYGAGDRVTHIKYGAGTVKEITEGARDYQVTVDFDGAGTKIMYAAFAKLKKI